MHNLVVAYRMDQSGGGGTRLSGVVIREGKVQGKSGAPAGSVVVVPAGGSLGGRPLSPAVIGC